MITAQNRLSSTRAVRFLFPLLVGYSLCANGEDSNLSLGLLELLKDPLEQINIEVHENLNSREISRRPEKPRLGGFADLPLGRLPRSMEIHQWESSYESGQIGGLALLICDACSELSDNQEFLTQWFKSKPLERAFLSYSSESKEEAAKISNAARDAGVFVKSFSVVDAPFAAELFATGGLRLGLDTRTARSTKSKVAEIELLGKRVRRNQMSVFKDSDRQWGRGVAQNEPSNFIKESLGDEFTQSTIREVIVPGGVALGETAKFRQGINELKFINQKLLLVDGSQKPWSLPEQDPAVVRSLFDFVQRSEQLKSDAIVDIDGDSRVRISSALRDTDAGWEIMHADTQPFQFVRNLNVTKSVIVDSFVRWSAANESLIAFDSEYEVRFLSADNTRIAQTRAAIVFSYDSLTGESQLENTWGRDKNRLKESLDMHGLSTSLSEVADYSGWVALFRSVIENDVKFLEGRYQFMKIDTAGRKTPARY